MSQILRLENATIGIAGRIFVEDMNLSISEGETIGLVGPNGTGKSLWVKSVAGEIPLLKGQMRLLNLPEPDQKKRAGLLAVIPQGLRPPLRVPCQAKEFLSWANCKDAAFEKHAVGVLLSGIDLDSRIQELSGGQWQRLLIAHALLHKPKLLILDETVEGVDRGHLDSVLELLREFATQQGSAVVMVSHDISAITKWVERVICLGGERPFDGDPKSEEFHLCLHRAYGEGSLIHSHEH
ncbi:MAG: hypothetical protein COT74_02435 [Bdellovibrionales bacterium CG10_big_fil_rev_8_21_14_0_10_45_34]|nr:MAG: hypothetical protein COT74_02435 [Bdellovibrionales bacterium CG10_big_fil_rev_8_21_14_0_10_45_34]